VNLKKSEKSVTKTGGNSACKNRTLGTGKEFLKKKGPQKAKKKTNSHGQGKEKPLALKKGKLGIPGRDRQTYAEGQTYRPGKAGKKKRNFRKNKKAVQKTKSVLDDQKEGLLYEKGKFEP